MEGNLKLSKLDGGNKEYHTSFEILVGNFRYLTCTRSDVMYVVSVVCCFMEYPTPTYMKVTKFFVTFKVHLILACFTHLLIS